MFLRHLKKFNWRIVFFAVSLSLLGMISIYSSQGDSSNFLKQAVFLTTGLMLMTVVSFFDWRVFKENSYIILFLYFLFIISLIGLFFFAPEIKGAKRWYKIGDLSFDPLEVGKIILIILFAKYFSMRHAEMYKLRHIFFSGIYVLIPSIFVFFRPDMGSAVILIFLWLGVLLFSGIKLRYFITIILIGLIIFGIGWSFFLKDYQKSRIINFISPQEDPLGAGWSQIQSKIAIGSGGIFGQGVLMGSQTQYGFLSEPHTDFIFAAIAEEMGFLGSFALFFIFLLLIRELFKIVFYSKSNFSRLFSAGLAVLLMAQFFVNIGMNLGILPVVGIPLPFVSYGGSSLISLFLSLGIIQSIKTH
ncbi:MAG: rod shape-determining protein RodA [Candidatus Pacebacteria bacterium]|nr:rod shape-determining protein RodA [Candidatus Paceibacterota bacterium]MDD3729325.1 rod shape-determining protein RodA [Candidatus Paceibacterota bacterium]MDD4201680.1 rod shape-determining protein RodA [Candidatus Paceibacterota bacterium]MDD5446141.1 rod shape-determining protein RodA [Candidatus Paceibacterota bacterium]